MSDQPPVSVTKLIIGALTLIVIAFVAGYFAGNENPSAITPPMVDGFLWPPPPPVDSLALLDSSGTTLDHSKFSGRWTLVFFGYTHCPDICPTTMQTLKEVSEKLAGHQTFDDQGQVLFVSVDPARDTPEVLNNYKNYFDPAFLAASAVEGELFRLTSQFGVQVTKISGDNPGEYYFDHSSSILLIGPDNRIIGVFVPPLDSSDIASQVRTIVDWGRSRN